MGLCESCCPRNRDDDDQDDDHARLLQPNGDGAAGHVPDGGLSEDDADEEKRIIHGGEFPKGASVPKPAVDANQAELQDILDEMTRNVLDAGMLESALEPPDYQEKAQEYGRRLNTIAHDIVVKHGAVNQTGGLVEAPNSQDDSPENFEATDTILINEVSSRAQESLSDIEFHLKNTEDLVACFGEDRKTTSSDEIRILADPAEVKEAPANEVPTGEDQQVQEQQPESQ